MKKIGLIVATKREAKYFLAGNEHKIVKRGGRLFYIGDISKNKYILTFSHAGPVNAGATSEAMIIHYDPDCIVNFGSAGSHSKRILPGDVVIGEKYTSNYNVLDEMNGIIRKKQSSLLRHYKIDKEERIEYLESDRSLQRKAKSIVKIVESKLIPMYKEENWFPNTLRIVGQ
jgi:nucleoside phosphorylase